MLFQNQTNDNLALKVYIELYHNIFINVLFDFFLFVWWLIFDELSNERHHTKRPQILSIPRYQGQSPPSRSINLIIFIDLVKEV